MSQPDLSATPPTDLSSCDREAIHLLGRVQDFGCLIALNTDWIVVHASQNIERHFGVAVRDLIGTRFADLLSEKALHHLRTRFQILAAQKSVARIYAYALFGDERLFDIAIHRADSLLVFEFMPREAPAPDRDDTSLVQALIGRIQRHTTIERMCEEAARAVQVLTGFDRVMVYQFETDGSGTVVAEMLSGAGEPYLGLRYPASDIPRQARELYKRNLLRIIADVNGPTHPILPERGPTGQPVDLSMAVTRAVSVIHLEYLRNMGVAASLSVSILRRGELWGLFACHHSAPLVIDFERRSALELFAQLFNYEIAQLEAAAEIEDVDRARDMHDRLTAQLSGGESLSDIFPLVAEEIRPVIPFDGIAVYSHGVYRAEGHAPTAEEFLGLARFLNTVQGTEVFATDAIGTLYDGADSFADRVAGLLALPISRRPRDYLVLFRREVASSVTWAGNPAKPADPGPNGLRLTPRKSFAAWREVVRGHSTRWNERERRAAQALRVTLLEAVLKLADEAKELRRQGEEQQKLLIAELNHRVRNILNLIRSLIAQSKGGVETMEEYSAVLDQRIHALARAHDQLTRQEWRWVPLASLIGTEFGAFLDEGAERVQISGDNVLLSPRAFTTFALLLHELVTNSVKYGALSQAGGEVLVDIRLDRHEGLTLAWTERGGPPVQAPTRRGFGTTIIQHSIPYDLKGEADVQYKVTGLEARFTVPAAHVAAEPVAQRPRPAPRPVPVAPSVPLSGPALLVEDNLIIAMETADTLAELGAGPVHTARSVAEGLAILAEHPIRFAILDVNLGEEVSLEVAQDCAARGIVTLLATGYDEGGGQLSAFPPFVVLNKPYGIDQMRAAIRDAQARHQAG